MKEGALLEINATSEESYLSSLKAFSEFYLRLIISVGAACAAAIVIAVIFNVIAGIVLALFSSTVYLYFTAVGLKRKLGISYKNINGSVIITHISAMYGNTVYIPGRLIWCDVTEIRDKALALPDVASMESIYIPKSIRRIGKDIFGDISVSAVIYYEGSVSDWESICKETDFSRLEVVYNTPQPKLSKKGGKSLENKEATL